MVKTSNLLRGKNVKNVKFVTVMPCYDKKLEAVRPTMDVPNHEDLSGQSLKQVMEVDTVIATHELIELFQKRNISNLNLVE